MLSGSLCPRAPSSVAGVSWVQKDPLALQDSGVSCGEDTSQSAEQAVEQMHLQRIISQEDGIKGHFICEVPSSCLSHWENSSPIQSCAIP